MKKVSVILPVLFTHEWQVIMTEACIRIMRATTDVPFELVVVETGSNYFQGASGGVDENVNSLARKREVWAEIDKYVNRPVQTYLTKDLNEGIRAASGDYIVHTGNDIFTRPGWLEALLQCFEIPDCGVATLAASDMKHERADSIQEGVYGPIFMFERGWEFDEDYKSIFSDSDLILRICETGKRSYRNWRVVVSHAYQATYQDMLSKQERDARYAEASKTFLEKHQGKSHTLVYRALVEGFAI